MSRPTPTSSSGQLRRLARTGAPTLALTVALALTACAGPGADPAAGATPVERSPVTGLGVAPAALAAGELPAGLEAVLRAYEAAWSAGDADDLAALFTEDGFVLSPGRPPVRGREAIRERYAGSGGPLDLRALAYEQAGPLAVVLGAFARSSEDPALGKFTLVLRRVGAGWLILSDMDNDDG